MEIQQIVAQLMAFKSTKSKKDPSIKDHKRDNKVEEHTVEWLMTCVHDSSCANKGKTYSYGRSVTEQASLTHLPQIQATLTLTMIALKHSYFYDVFTMVICELLLQETYMTSLAEVERISDQL